MERRMRACPAVSVIIPMYNAEKYVADCLDSLLEQTFTDFEAIVVDDCSTDTGAAIVESYIPKFDGRLKLSRTEKNSGGCAVPRNRGFKFACGEYVLFVDSDDMLASNALETLYSIMESYENVDLIHCTTNYLMSENGQNFKVIQTPKYNSEAVLAPYDNLVERINDVINHKFWREAWRTFTRRKFLIEHEIYFPDLKPGEEVVWFYTSLFCAKKALLLSKPIYIYRYVDNSIMHLDRPPQQMVQHCVNPIILGTKILDNYMGKVEFFQRHPEYRYEVMQSFMLGYFYRFLEKSCQIQSDEVYEAIMQEFGDRLGEQDVLISALCALINNQQKALAINQQQFKRLAEKSQRELQASRQQFKELAAQVQQVIDDLEARLK